MKRLNDLEYLKLNKFQAFLYKLKLFFEWGIDFDCEPYTIADKGARSVSYANREMIEYAVMAQIPKSRGEHSFGEVKRKAKPRSKKRTEEAKVVVKT